MKYLLILLVMPFTVFSQEVEFVAQTPVGVSFKSILRKATDAYVNDTTQAIRYPIVIANNDNASDKINKQVRLGLFTQFKNVANKQAIDLLDSFITIGLNKMTYKTTFNNKGILSLTVTYQLCGANSNCVDTSVILNFDVSTGKALAIDDIISKDNLDLFMKGVQVDKSTALNKYKDDLKNQLGAQDVSKADYTTATNNVNTNCLTSVQVKNFILTETGIEILDDCDFPQSLDEIKPAYHLIYPYSTIKSLLNKDFADKML